MGRMIKGSSEIIRPVHSSEKGRPGRQLNETPEIKPPRGANSIVVFALP